MESSLTKIRRNIHTYPFKYSYIPDETFFRPHPGVLYLHIPFCSTKCHFCDYTVYVGKGLDTRERYVAALCQEIRQFPENPAFPRFEIEAIYFGGGTPGLLSAAQLNRILAACRESFSLTEDCEVAVEFDPNAVELEKLQEIWQGGFNRLSVGVQTFNEGLLKQSNRPHDAASIYRAFEAVRASEFTHVNLDLIYPLPGLSTEIWQDSVAQALDFEPACLTVYGLEIWPGTAYHNWLERGKLPLPGPNEEAEMYTYAMERLENAGYLAASNSGYYHPERTARYCRFLDFYWRTWPMIGLGVSSKSVVYDHLWVNVKPLGEYFERLEAGRVPMDFATLLTKVQEMRRVMIRGLKMCEVSKADFLERFGVPMDLVFSREIEALATQGLLVDEPDRVALTPKGRTYGTNVYEQFYTEEDLRPPMPGEVQFGISQLVASA
ncbi:MAG TPA: coproporphyrinogen-III oxidase family protein [Thermoanaerobaculia bacterium]|nr:coproporphyrinogen-III oxidase family protein [Thermoanaerobaculia bacterium]